MLASKRKESLKDAECLAYKLLDAEDSSCDSKTALDRRERAESRRFGKGGRMYCKLDANFAFYW